LRCAVFTLFRALLLRCTLARRDTIAPFSLPSILADSIYRVMPALRRLIFRDVFSSPTFFHTPLLPYY